MRTPLNLLNRLPRRHRQSSSRPRTPEPFRLSESVRPTQGTERTGARNPSVLGTETLEAARHPNYLMLILVIGFCAILAAFLFLVPAFSLYLAEESSSSGEWDPRWQHCPAL